MTQNRRRHTRVKAKGVAAHYRAGEEMALAMPVENVSLGGIFVRTQEPLPLGTALSMELLDGAPDKPLKLTGRVVGTVTTEQSKELSRPAGMGIQFDTLSDEDAVRLNRLLMTLKQRANQTSGGAIVDHDMQDARKSAFDFGFASLESYGVEAEEEEAANSRRSRPREKAAYKPPEVRVPAPAEQVNVPPEARLMVQVKGLLSELEDARQELQRKDREIERLTAEIERLTRGRR